MDIQSLELSLKQLEEGTIERIDVDLCKHTISMVVSVFVSQGTKIERSVIFEDVSSFYFVNGAGERRFNRPEWDRVELSEFRYYDESVDHITHHSSHKKRVPEYHSLANFVLEMWSSVLFIEAKSIIIDSTHFEVGYPQVSNK